MKEFVCEHGTTPESDLLAIVEKYFRKGCCVYAVHTDHFYCGTELKMDGKHLIELRIFTENDEFKISRLNIGTDFSWRYIDDAAFQNALSGEKDEFLSVFSNRVFDEMHYLDIDSTRSKGCNYTTTGGGRYTLPVENAEKVSIRNYLEYDENGIVKISDFRIVGFTQKGSEAHGS